MVEIAGGVVVSPVFCEKVKTSGEEVGASFEAVLHSFFFLSFGAVLLFFFLREGRGGGLNKICESEKVISDK